METESTKTTGAQGEANTGKKEGSFMEMCMSCCGDKAKMEEIGKMMKSCCGDKAKMEDMVKKMKDCVGDPSKMAEMGKMMKSCCK
jgi:hypothetical protein